MTVLMDVCEATAIDSYASGVTMGGYVRVMFAFCEVFWFGGCEYYSGQHFEYRFFL